EEEEKPAQPVKPAPDEIGEEVPPITPDKVSAIDTKNGAALKHLIFETTASEEAGRYLSEFLMVIRSSESSCVRLKVRPTSGITDQVDDSVFANGVEGTGACKGQKLGGEQGAGDPAEDEKEDGEGDAAAGEGGD